MNYLAHLYLAEDSPESILGNFLGDFVKGSAIARYTDGIKKGIELHRKIDAYTDCHAVFRESKRLISDRHKRYAGIIIDIFYDHFLAKSWSDYSAISLNDFTFTVYNVLEANAEILPKNVKTYLPKLKGENWLMCYGTIEGITLTLKRVSLRLKRKNDLEKALEDLNDNYRRFESDFRKFFPELIKYAETMRQG